MEPTGAEPEASVSPQSPGFTQVLRKRAQRHRRDASDPSHADATPWERKSASGAFPPPQPPQHGLSSQSYRRISSSTTSLPAASQLADSTPPPSQPLPTIQSDTPPPSTAANSSPAHTTPSCAPHTTPQAGPQHAQHEQRGLLHVASHQGLPSIRDSEDDGDEESPGYQSLPVAFHNAVAAAAAASAEYEHSLWQHPVQSNNSDPLIQRPSTMAGAAPTGPPQPPTTSNAQPPTTSHSQAQSPMANAAQVARDAAAAGAAGLRHRFQQQLYSAQNSPGTLSASHSHNLGQTFSGGAAAANGTTTGPPGTPGITSAAQGPSNLTTPNHLFLPSHRNANVIPGISTTHVSASEGGVQLINSQQAATPQQSQAQLPPLHTGNQVHLLAQPVQAPSPSKVPAPSTGANAAGGGGGGGVGVVVATPMASQGLGTVGDERMQTFWEYLAGEAQPAPKIPTADVVWGQTERDRVYNFLLYVPYQLERLIQLGTLICWDSLVAVVTIMPCRAVAALLQLCGVFQLLGWPATHQRQPSTPNSSQARTARLAGYQLYDLLCLCIVVSCTVVLRAIKPGFIYYWLKDITSEFLKMSVLSAAFEITDKILSNFGMDVMEALSGTCTLWVAGRRSSGQLLADTLVAWGITFTHALTLMCEGLVLAVALNSSRQGLLALLIANNFVEIKGAVFKRWDVPRIWGLVCQDIVERMHLWAVLFFVVVEDMESSASWRPSQTVLWESARILGAEVIIDVIKHAVLGKFNDVRPGIYREYTKDLCEKAVASQSHSLNKLMGFQHLPTVCLILRGASTLFWMRLDVAGASSVWKRAIWLAFYWFLLLLLKPLVGYALKKQADSYVRYYNANFSKHVSRPHREHPISLARVTPTPTLASTFATAAANNAALSAAAGPGAGAQPPSSATTSTATTPLATPAGKAGAASAVKPPLGSSTVPPVMRSRGALQHSGAHAQGNGYQHQQQQQQQQDGSVPKLLLDGSAEVTRGRGASHSGGTAGGGGGGGGGGGKKNKGHKAQGLAHRHSHKQH